MNTSIPQFGQQVKRKDQDFKQVRMADKSHRRVLDKRGNLANANRAYEAEMAKLPRDKQMAKEGDSVKFSADSKAAPQKPKPQADLKTGQPDGRFDPMTGLLFHWSQRDPAQAIKLLARLSGLTQDKNK